MINCLSNYSKAINSEDTISVLINLKIYKPGLNVKTASYVNTYRFLVFERGKNVGTFYNANSFLILGI